MSRTGALILRRLLGMLAALWAASILAFGLLAILPGDPATMMASRGNQRPTPEAVQLVRAQIGLDRPFAMQYASWLRRAVVGDFSRSWMTGASVAGLLAQRLGPTLLLGAAIFLLAAFGTLVLGGFAALWPGGALDHGVRLIAILGAALPSFVLGLLAIRFIAVGLGLGSVIGDGTWRTLGLPASVGALGLMAYWVRPFRGLVRDALASDWALVCRARGVSEPALLCRHALPNALVGFLPFIGIGLAGLLAGSLFIENVFSWPGIGPFVVDAIKRRDLPIIQAFALLAAAFYILSSGLADLIAAWLDPIRRPVAALRQ